MKMQQEKKDLKVLLKTCSQRRDFNENGIKSKKARVELEGI